uniref:RNase H type-1 domain-containing protein n=1 Tax=Quercus lobata TaxID=97700 RepID=A0A7N2M135_QUELO
MKTSTLHTFGTANPAQQKKPWYKVNMDSAVFKSVGIGVIVSDHAGAVLAALSTQLRLPLGPLEAEGKAMDVAISFAKDIGLQEVTFESDCSVLIGALSDTLKVPISTENIVTGIHNKLQHFRQHQMLHVKRQGNTPAHNLVRHDKGLDNFVTWIGETLIFY